jgi:nicotinate-nucleotide adenylyltransferase
MRRDAPLSCVVVKEWLSMSEFLNSWNNMQNSIVVFAGVFDPVHNGHISAAERALHFGSQVLFMPERVPQHKHSATAYKHRLTMLRKATAKNKAFSVIDYPKDHHWIADTFQWLKKKYPNKSFIWMVGSDVAPLMHEWQGIDKLESLGVSRILIVKREGNDIDHFKEIGSTAVTYIHRPIQKHENLSSTAIRADVKRCRKQVNALVYSYIKEHRLYSFADSASK